MQTDGAAHVNGDGVCVIVVVIPAYTYLTILCFHKDLILGT